MPRLTDFQQMNIRSKEAFAHDTVSGAERSGRVRTRHDRVAYLPGQPGTQLAHPDDRVCLTTDNL